MTPETTALSILLSVALIPHLTAIIVQLPWPNYVKGLVALVLSLGLALAQLGLEDRLVWQNLSLTVGIIAVSAHYFYESISKGLDQTLQAKVNLFPTLNAAPVPAPAPDLTPDPTPVPAPAPTPPKAQG